MCIKKVVGVTDCFKMTWLIHYSKDIGSFGSSTSYNLAQSMSMWQSTLRSWLDSKHKTIVFGSLGFSLPRPTFCCLEAKLSFLAQRSNYIMTYCAPNCTNTVLFWLNVIMKSNSSHLVVFTLFITQHSPFFFTSTQKQPWFRIFTIILMESERAAYV